MAKARIVYKSKVYKDGTRPICLVIHEIKDYSKVIAAVEPKHWDAKNKEVKRSHHLWYDINRNIKEALISAQRHIMECEVKGEPVRPGRYLDSNKGTLLYDLLISKFDKLTATGKHGTAARVKVVANKVKGYDNTAIADNVDEEWARGFDRWLTVKHGNSANTRERTHREIRAFCKSAYQDFKPKREATVHVHLSKDEVDLLYNAELSQSMSRFRDFWLFSYYLRGMRVHDCMIMKSANIDGDRIKYYSQKSEFKRYYNVKIGERAKTIIDRNIGNSKHDYIFDIMQMKQSLSNEFRKEVDRRNSYVRNNLHKICNKLDIPRVSMHVARYSWAVHKYKAGVPLGAIQKALGHSDPQTTVIYLQHVIDEQELDAALGED